MNIKKYLLTEKQIRELIKSSLIFYYLYTKIDKNQEYDEKFFNITVEQELSIFDRNNRGLFIIDENILKYYIEEKYKLKKFLRKEALPSSSVVEDIVEGNLSLYLYDRGNFYE